MTFDALLAHISPTVPRHPLTLAFGTFVLSKASFLSLVRCQTFAFWTCLEWVFSSKIIILCLVIDYMVTGASETK